MAQLKIGMIGAGGIAGVHLPHLAAREDIELTALSDVNPAGVATAEKFGIGHFTSDFRELLPLVDAVLICVPTFLHATIASEALRMGKPTFCEKPLARTLEEADLMAQASREGRVPLQVGFVRRFDAEWLAWRDAVQAGKIGRPVVWNDVSTHGGPSAPWYYNEVQGGGPFLDGCIHNFDFALHTFGPAQWVFCNGLTWRERTTAIDTGTATIRFESGDELMLKWSWALPGKAHGARVFELLGPGGTLTWPADGGAVDGQRLSLSITAAKPKAFTIQMGHSMPHSKHRWTSSSPLRVEKPNRRPAPQRDEPPCSWLWPFWLPHAAAKSCT